MAKDTQTMNGFKLIRSRAPHLAAIILLGLGCHINTLSNGFVFDDSAYLASVLVREMAIGEIFTANWLGLDIYRPLALLSLSCDFRLYGEAPMGFHLTNTLLHAINGLLFYALACELVSHRRAALWAALVYICHPLQTEVVGWVSARGDLLASSFFLGGFLAYLYERRTASWILYAAAVLSKETAVILPAVLLLHAYWLKRAEGNWRVRVMAWCKRHWGYGVALVAVLVLRLAVLEDTDAPAGPTSTNFLSDLDIVPRWATVVSIWARYALLLALPVRLSADYSFASIPPVSSLSDPWFIAGLIVVMVSVFLPWWTYSRRLAFSIAFLWLSLLPVSNVFVLAPSGMAERYLHLGLVAVTLAVGWGVARSSALRRLWPLGVIAVLLLSAITINRNRDWRSDFSLFSAVIEYYPDNARAHDNLAYGYYQRGDFVSAIYHYQRAIDIQPTRLRAHFNLGMLYSQARRYHAALASFRDALALHPNHVETHFNIGLTHQKMQQYAESIGHYQAVLKLDPSHAKTFYNLGRAYEQTDRLSEAAAQYESLIELNPVAAKSYYRLGEVYHRLGYVAQMIEAWTALLRIEPDHAHARRVREIIEQNRR